jgi:hypothetical protein
MSIAHEATKVRWCPAGRFRSPDEAAIPRQPDHFQRQFCWQALSDTRHGKNTRHLLTSLLRAEVSQLPHQR